VDAITHCRGCECSDITPFFDLGDLPLANGLVSPGTAEPDARYPLSLSFCPECGLVQLNHTADPEELFSQYVWVTGTSATAQSYARLFRDRAFERIHRTETPLAPKDSFIVEVASNDGTFLRPFQEAGSRVLGIDPANNIVKAANEQGIPTRCDFFGETVAREVVTEHGHPDIVFARNVIPHVANLHDFAEGLRVCLEGGGILAAEVHYAKEILENLHYDSIYHEHLCYFTLKSFEALLARHGMFAFDLESSPISGGSIVVYASLEKRPRSHQLDAFAKAEADCATNELTSWNQFAATAIDHRDHLVDMIHDALDRGHVLIGYGASARSSTLLNFCGIGPDMLPVIADQSPLKHGLLTAGNRIPIVAPDTAMESIPDTVVILAWNFLEEIAGILRDTYGFTGKILAPLPFPPTMTTADEVCRD